MFVMACVVLQIVLNLNAANAPQFRHASRWSDARKAKEPSYIFVSRSLALAVPAFASHICCMAERTPAGQNNSSRLADRKVSSEVADFVQKVSTVARPTASRDGRLLF